jgi:hypothetical protein
LAGLQWWDPVVSAPLHSQLCGVLAGVAFVGITLVLTRQVPFAERDDHGLARLTVGQFLIGFLALAVAAFEWGVLSGYSTNGDAAARPAAAAVFASVTLSLGAVEILAGICYLVLDFDARTERRPTTRGLRRACRSSYSLIAVLATYNLLSTAGEAWSRGFYAQEYPAFEWVGIALSLVIAGALSEPMSRRGASLLGRIAGRLSTSHPFSIRRAFTLAIAASVVGFSVIGDTPLEDPLVRPGTWHDSAPMILLAGAGALLGVTLALFVVKGWLIAHKMGDLDSGL